MPMRRWENPSFFKVMIGEFDSSVRIPPAFNKHFGETIRRRAVVRNPRGQEWEINVEYLEGEAFFQDGWKSFISNNKVTFGDFLVFFYDGDSGFDVKIYGTTCCEKKESVDYPVDIMEIDGEEEGKEEEKEKEKEEEKKGEEEEEKGEKKEKDKEEEEEEKGEEGAEMQTKTPPACRGGKTEASTSRKSSRRGRVKKNLCYKVMKAAKAANNDKALRAACSVKFTHPHFIAACRSSRNGYMAIPLELAKKYKLAEKSSITLRDPQGISWTVKLTTWRDGRICFTYGWALLYENNGLKEGDVCIFEFVSRGTMVDVHIFRAREYNEKPGLLFDALSGLSWYKVISHVIFRDTN